MSSSIVSMEPLLKIEQILVQALNDHANKMQEKVNEMRRGISTMRKQREIYSIDAEEFLSRPFHSFPMLRRLKHEWKAWLKYLKEPITSDFVKIIEDTLKNVQDFDLTPSAESVQGLCDLYEIEPNDWIKGKLHFAEFDMPFTTLDCYAIAFLLYKREKYEVANKWFDAALISFKPRPIYEYVIGFSRQDIYETYVENLLKQNRSDIAFELISNAIDIDPTNSGITDLMSQIEKIMESMNKSSVDLQVDKKVEKIKNACRIEFIANPSNALYCSYNWNINDFVRLAPFKFELLHEDPILILYHEVLNEDELSDLEILAEQKLKKQTIYSTSSAIEIWDMDSKHASAHVRIDAEYNDFSTLLNQRLEDMTGLFTFDSNIMIGNYGVGGYSIAHTDCLEICDHNSKEADCDARLATILIFLTDAIVGGGTIFPELDVGVYPPKGAALLWYNLHNDMASCDSRTLHMTCPVVSGSKWFLTKWIQFKNQIFRKPCLAK